MKSKYTFQDILAIILFLVSVFLLANGLFMDTTLPVDYPGDNNYGFPERVENIHLANEKQNYLIFGGILFISSIILMVTSKKVEKNISSINEYKEDDLEDKNIIEAKEDDEIETIRKNLTNGFFNK